MRLGAKLRQIRESQRKSLKEIAERANLSVAQLSKLELGDRGLDVEVFADIARALGHQPGDLIPNSAGLFPEFRSLLTRLGAVPEAERRIVLMAIGALLDVREGAVVESLTPVQAESYNVRPSAKTDDLKDIPDARQPRRRHDGQAEGEAGTAAKGSRAPRAKKRHSGYTR